MSDAAGGRVLIAASGSGCGKTTFTCGLLNLLKKRGCDITSYKCGPDYIDPMFHRTVLGTDGGNLDTFFCARETVRQILAQDTHEYAVLEGVMGVYDGLGGLSAEASSYDIASATSTPIVLLIDAYGAGNTLVSQLKGILADDTEHLIKGIIFNRVNASFYKRLAEKTELELKKAGYSTRLLGCVPKAKITMESRHLGLVMPDEIPGLHQQLDSLSQLIEANCDIEGLLEVMCSSEPLKESRTESSIEKTENLRLAVAMDEAFCFYYSENLSLFKEYGVEIVPFSPIYDSALPPKIDGILLGGGYPELKLRELSDNTEMRKSIRDAVENGLPSLAECGGFMYLHDSIAGEDGKNYPMAGVISGSCENKGKLVRFGYIQLEADQSETQNKLQCALDGMRGHEFHYYDSTNNGTDINVVKPVSGLSWKGMYIGADHIWGYPHLYYRSKPELVSTFVEVMKNGRKL